MSNEKPTVYFVERCMYHARLKHLTSLASKSNVLNVSGEYSQKITHVIAQESTKDDVIDYLVKTKKWTPDTLLEQLSGQKLVDISWFVTCMREKRLVPVAEQYLLKQETEEKSSKRPKLDQEETISTYACQRSSPLNHKNTVYTDALEILEEHAMYRGDPNAESRALAFRRGSAVLKSLPHKISHESQINNLPHIGVGSCAKSGHCRKVILEILAEGYSREAEEVSHSEFFSTMKLFCGIFGVGPHTARKWFYDLKLKSLDDVKNCPSITLNRDQSPGLEYYEDLNSPIPLDEAKEIEVIVKEAARSVQEGLEVTMVGGFRRGKKSGHDVDFLITHPEEGKEKSVLSQMLVKLKDRFIYSHQKLATSENPYEKKLATIDHFEKCYGIFKVFKKSKEREWTARRVDLIIVPYSQFPFALLGWTGSRHFEREIRRYAKSEKKIILTSHGMYPLKEKGTILAKSEEEIFEILGLKYQEPYNRNC